jgi:hypothetical protein
MPSYSTRAIFVCPNCPRKKKYAYEERITVWEAKTQRIAIRRGEAEAKRYAKSVGSRYLSFIQSYWLFENLPADGIEVFSLIRESDLPPKKYIDAYFYTGSEKERSIS